MKRIVAAVVILFVGFVPSAFAASKPKGASSCIDALGDGQGADLGTTTLRAQGKLLSIVWDTPVAPVGPERAWYISIAGSGGSPSYQIGLKEVAGETFKFVFNFAKASQRNLQSSAAITDRDARLLVSFSNLRGLGRHPTWRSTITMAGSDVDACPEGELDATRWERRSRTG